MAMAYVHFYSMARWRPPPVVRMIIPPSPTPRFHFSLTYYRVRTRYSCIISPLRAPGSVVHIPQKEIRKAGILYFFRCTQQTIAQYKSPCMQTQ